MKTYKLYQPHPKIFVVAFKDRYDLAMTFFRYQEFYESPRKEVYRNPSLSLTALIRSYGSFGKGSKEEVKDFSYFNDWGGFNIPSFVFKLIHPNIVITDPKTWEPTKYDHLMKKILNQIYDLLPEGNRGKFYLIGILKDKDKKILNHELSHAFYFLDPEYKERINKLIKQIPNKLYEKFRKQLKKAYGKNVIDDEIQAYLVSGFIKNQSELKKKLRQKFKKIFKVKLKTYDNY